MRSEYVPKDPENPKEVSKCLNDMNMAIIDNINKAIGSNNNTKLYCLGDVAFITKAEPLIDLYSKINTSQHRLLFGNHDNPEFLLSTKLFKKSGIWRVFKGEDFTLSHIPIHKDSLKTTYNVHGHCHNNVVLNEDGTENLTYINICVEKTEYNPVHLDDITRMIRLRKEKQG